MALFISLLLHAILTIEVLGYSNPNIIYLLVDDLGYNDIGYHDPNIEAPVLTQLASEGIILENNYVAPLCGPSRAALLTGRYNFHLGFQTTNFLRNRPGCLTKENPILPEALKQLGYNTYMLGKWGMGFCNIDCTPTYRGFDRFHGFYGDLEGHYNHSTDHYDFRDDLVPDTCSYGKYSTELLGARAVEYIDHHVTSEITRDNPFFMYFAFQTVHTPLEVPLEYLERHNNELDHDRRFIKAMISFTNDVIGNLVQKLKNHGLYNNSIIIFSSDNGHAAIRTGHWKLIKGFPGIYDGYDIRSTGLVSLYPLKNGEWGEVVPLYENSTMLFDLEADPAETTDLAEEYPEVVRYLETLLQEYSETAVPLDPAFERTEPLSNAELYGYVYSYGWC